VKIILLLWQISTHDNKTKKVLNFLPDDDDNRVHIGVVVVAAKVKQKYNINDWTFMPYVYVQQVH